MASVRIDYDARTQRARISIDQNGSTRQWSAVRRLFEERSSSTEVNGFSVLLPWWEFIAHRDALRYVLKIEKLSLSVSESARELLLAAVERERLFHESSDGLTEIIPVDEIDERLDDAGFVRRLLPYQKRNVSALTARNSGATFSVPGAGKTTEALAFYFLRRAPEEKLLVVAPKNAFVAWEEELPACAPNFSDSVQRLIGGSENVRSILQENPTASVISYHQIPYVMDELYAFLARNRVCMMIDESHRMKRGDDGVHGACLLSLSFMPCRKLILSGTPMPNSSADLVPQFRFLYPEIRTSSESVIDDFQTCFVRTTKGELGLPPVHRVAHLVEMSITQRELYETLASDAARILAGFSASDRLRFRSVGRSVQYLIQAASNPGLLVSSNVGEHELLKAAIADGVSLKLKEACRIARAWVREGKKVLIWSGFVKTVEHIAALLSDVGAEYIHGGVGTDDDEENFESREAVIKRFNDFDSSTRVLVANPAACSEGISLHHVCHNAIYVDRNYNAAQYLQSEDRIHRIGLPKDVTTYVTHLVSPGTIDDSVARRLVGKVDRMRDALNDPHLNITPMLMDDLSDGLDLDDISDLRVLLEGGN
jgi:SNF2 family DNA or RNA helicase